MKKKFYKKLWFLVIIAFVAVGIVGCLDETEETADNQEGENTEETEENTDNQDAEDIEEIEEPEPREDAIGKSDKDFSELTNSKPSSVRGDNTGNWRKTTIAESVDIIEYIVSYNEIHMEKDEVHAIINFNYKTTAMMNDFGSFISVRIHEYVDKEEHDASKLGGGMFLKEYHIYKDNGDIVEVE